MKILPVDPNSVVENWKDLLFQVGLTMLLVIGLLIALPAGMLWIGQSVLGMTHTGASLLSVWVTIAVAGIPLFIIRE